jgi:hypothetical protein
LSSTILGGLFSISLLEDLKEKLETSLISEQVYEIDEEARGTFADARNYKDTSLAFLRFH